MSRKNHTGAIAAGHEETAAAAAEILADGGNAFDAAIAALWAACIAEPVLASPGGGGFMMALHQGRAHLFDFFVDTPARKRPASDIEFKEIHADFGPATQAFHIGHGASATPGFVPGLFAIHQALATLPMPRLAEPALRLARDGVEITPFQAYVAEVVSPILTASEDSRALFAPTGRTHSPGTLFRNPELADVIDTLAREGERFAREGELSRILLHGQHEAGHLTATDLTAYRVMVREPLRRSIGACTTFLNPPPSLGGSLIAAMFARLPENPDPDEPQRSLSLAEAIGEIDALWRARPAAIAELVTISMPGEHPLASRGTTHVSIADRNGNTAAVTVSNGEGNGHLLPGAGFMLNNMLGEEDLNPQGFHRWPPSVRMASMMSPTIAATPDGATIALGSGGSNRIRTALFQVLANHLLLGDDLATAVERPRLHVERGRLDFEPRSATGTAEALISRFPDHCQWHEPNMFFGGVHAASHHPHRGFAGAGDLRRSGVFLII